MPEEYASRPHARPVALDIGRKPQRPHIYTDQDLHGDQPTGRDYDREHKDVSIVTSTTTTSTLVFDRLDDGNYTLWAGGVAIATNVHITGRTITDLDRRAQPQAPSTASRPHRRRANAAGPINGWWLW